MTPRWEVRLSDPARERRRFWLALLGWLCIPLAFGAGLYWPQSDESQVAGESQALQMQLAEQEQELELLRQRLAVFDSSERVGQQTLEQTRRTIKLLEDQIFRQQQELAAYKAVLAPDSRREGLRIRAFELQATDDPRLFRYKVLMSRDGVGDDPLQGLLHVSVEGRQSGEDVSIPLSALSSELDAAAISFSFKQFQAFPEAGRFGEIRLPEAFEPHQVKVMAEVEGDEPQEHRFDWIKSGETATHVE